MSSTTENTAELTWGAAGSAGRIGGSIANAIGGGIRALRTWRVRRRDVARLEALDERMLRDIGLTKSEIGHVVRFGRDDV